MKKTILSVALPIAILVAACDVSNIGNYILNQYDAAAAIRQLLQIGTASGNDKSLFTKDNIVKAVLPEKVAGALTTIQQLGLSNEVDRFMNTLGAAAESAADKSVPVFEQTIKNMSFADAVAIVKGNNTAATDYLRSRAGDSLRRAISPAMTQALNEYNLLKQWNGFVQPLQRVVGNKINLDLSNMLAGAITEIMFQKMEAKEIQIRTEISARTTPLLQRVFGAVDLTKKQ